MAIFLPNQTKCSLCGEIVEEVSKTIFFPPFSGVESDPLHVLNDAVVHEKCLSASPLETEAIERKTDFGHFLNPQNRICRVCNHLVDSPDEYLGWACLGVRKDLPVANHEYQHYHKECLAGTGLLGELISVFVELSLEKPPAGDYAKAILHNLKELAG